MCSPRGCATLVGMTNESVIRRIWVSVAVVVLGAGVVGRELIRSGFVGDGLVSTWYGQVGLTVAGLAVVGLAGLLIDRAYRRRAGRE
jgi:uncharacterized membrane protein